MPFPDSWKVIFGRKVPEFSTSAEIVASGRSFFMKSIFSSFLKSGKLMFSLITF